jgi:hypothetical protein
LTMDAKRPDLRSFQNIFELFIFIVLSCLLAQKKPHHR